MKISKEGRTTLKSTEIVVEQLIIGLLFLAIIYLFVFGHSPPLDTSADTAFNKFVFTAVIVLVAYAAGIVVDRWADTLLQNLEKQQRLAVALQRIKHRELRAMDDDPEEDDRRDLLPEDVVRIRILVQGNDVVDYHDYLRTRLRITRAITCLAPALFVALLLFHIEAVEGLRAGVGAAVALVYVIAFLLTEMKTEGLPPKTHQIKKIKKYVGKGPADEYIQLDSGLMRLGWPLVLGLGGIIAVSVWITFTRTPTDMDPKLLSMYPVGALLVTLLAGSTWWRIAKTFFVYISDYNRVTLQGNTGRESSRGTKKKPPRRRSKSSRA